MNRWDPRHRRQGVENEIPEGSSTSGVACSRNCTSDCRCARRARRPWWRTFRRVPRRRLPGWAGLGHRSPAPWGFVLRVALLRPRLLRAALLPPAFCLRSRVRLRSTLRAAAAVFTARVSVAKSGTSAAGRRLLVLLPELERLLPVCAGMSWRLAAGTVPTAWALAATPQAWIKRRSACRSDCRESGSRPCTRRRRTKRRD